MLVLSRKKGESIVLATTPPITITVVEIRGGKVRLGIEAPPKIKVLRTELLENETNKPSDGHATRTRKRIPDAADLRSGEALSSVRGGPDSRHQ